jgi:hypothetical protein
VSGTTSRQFQAVVTVSDRTAGPLAAISARLRAIAGMNGLQRIQAATVAVRQSFTQLAGSLTRLAVPLAVLGGAGAAGLYSMVRATVDAGGALQDMAARLGIAVDQLQALDYAGRQSGVSSETMAASLERLQRGIAEAAAGRNQNLVALFRQLRIPLRDANGQIRSAADLMPELARAFEVNTNAAMRTRMAMALFGRAGGPLIAMLSEGQEALAGNVEEWRRLDGVIGVEHGAMLKRVGDAITRVQQALTGLRNAIVVQLAPALEPMLNRLAEWIASNKEIISTTLARWVQQLGEALSQIDWAKVVEDVRAFVNTARELFEKIGGWHTVLIAVGAYMAGPLIASITALALAITTTLIPPLIRATGLMAAMGAARIPAIAGAGAAGQAAAGAAGAAAGRMGGLAGLGAAGAIAGGAALLYQNINPVTPDQARRLGLPNLMQPQDGYDVTGRPIPADRSSLYRPQSAPAPAAPQGQVDVRVRLEGLPRGSQVDARATGQGLRDPQIDVGFATLGAP